jgi:hypothetical protein
MEQLSEDDGYAILAGVISRDTDKLTDTEFRALYIAICLGSNVKRIGGYTKVSSIFTEEDDTKMELATWEVFQALYQERLDKQS